MNKRISGLFILCIVINFSIEAQSYNTAFGFRLGEQLGFNFTQRIANHATVELNASNGLFSNKKFINLNLRQHYPVITRRFNFYLGIGGFRESYIQDIQNDEGDYQFDNAGLNGLLGAEITFGRLNLSIDYMPKYILNHKTDINQLQADSAISIKYVLWKRKSKIKKFFEKIF